MSFDVQWSHRAQTDLARLWNSARNRRVVTRAANEIDRLLELDAAKVGESRGPRERVLLESPLGVIYRVDARRHVVKVISIGVMKRRH
jgi:hypothetical protein